MDNLLKDHRCPTFAAVFAAKVGKEDTPTLKTL